MGENNGDEAVRTDFGAFRLLLASSTDTFRSVVVIAAIVSSVVFLSGYGIAHHGGFGRAYLQSVVVYLVLSGIFVGQVIVLWGAKLHLRVWTDVRRCFDVDDETYAAATEPILGRCYSVRRLGSTFLLALVLVFVVDLTIGIPYAIIVFEEGAPMFGGCLWNLGGCVTHLAAINYLYGIVVLFAVVAGIHGTESFLTLVFRVSDLPLASVETAAERLEPIVRFSVFASTASFGGVILVLVDYGIVYTNTSVSSWSVVLNSGVVLGVIAGLILMSMSIFWIPQLAIHATLSAAKQERLATITDEYDDLLDRCRSESGSPDHLTAELEIVEAQRRNAAGIRTWSYNLPFLLQVGASAVASTGLWLLEMRNLL